MFKASLVFALWRSGGSDRAGVILARMTLCLGRIAAAVKKRGLQNAQRQTAGRVPRD
jgi:hypothetical protein